MSYPEHEKLKALNGANQTIGAFIEWFEQEGRVLAVGHEHTEDCDPPRDEDRFAGRTCGRFASGNGILYAWEPPGRGARIDRIVALYFGIDLDKLEDEKLAMLDSIRQRRGAAVEDLQAMWGANCCAFGRMVEGDALANRSAHHRSGGDRPESVQQDSHSRRDRIQVE